MIFDTHFHTEFSFDSEEKIESYIEKAEELGIGLTVTDHLDKNLNNPGFSFYRDFDPDLYRETYGPLRNEKLFLGIECGMDPLYSVESLEFISKVEPDFVIGSVHTLYGKDIYGRENYENMTREEFYRKYFRFMLECLKTHEYINSLGHIDYPARYNPYENQGFTFTEFREEMTPIFEFLKDRDMALELNIRRFRNIELREELKDIYLGFKECGGKFVTLGTDSHVSSNIGELLPDADRFIRDIGLSPVHYEKGKPVTDS